MKSSSLFFRLCLTALIAIPVTGCLSFKATPDPTQFYVLSPVATEALEGVEGDVALCIQGVTIPEYLEVSWLVTREEGNRIRRVSFHQWGETLSAGVQQAVIGNLSTELGTSDILVMARERPGESRFFITLTITRFDITPQGEASIAASWRIRNSGTPDFELSNRMEQIATFAWDPADFGGAVDALNGLLADVCAGLAGDIVDSGLIR